MSTLMTGVKPTEKRAVPELEKMLKQLEIRMAADHHKLPKAWYERRKYGTTQRSAAFHWGVRPADIRCVEHLWRILDYSREEYADLLAQSRPAWVFEVDEKHEETSVWLDFKAIEDIVLVALEAYAVPRQGAKFTETYGICFGSTRSTEEKRQGLGRYVKRQVNVRSVHIQLRAECYPNKVVYDLRSLETQMAVVTKFFPHLDIVGDFHTHPYRDVESLRSSRGWNFSPDDEASLPDWIAPLMNKGFHPRISIIVAIAEGSKRITKPGRLKSNIARFSVGKYHFYLAAYRIIGSKYSDEHVTLNSIVLPGI
jgi:hypothetical protein